MLLTAVVCTSGEHASLTVSEWSNFPSFLPSYQLPVFTATDGKLDGAWD